MKWKVLFTLKIQTKITAIVIGALRIKNGNSLILTPCDKASSVYCFSLSFTAWSLILPTADFICSSLSPAFSPAYQNKDKLHYKNTPIQIYRKFHLQKLKIFR